MIEEKKGPKLKYIYKKENQPIFSRTGERKKNKKD